MRTTRIVEMLEVTEAAALAAGRWMGKGDKHAADAAAVGSHAARDQRSRHIRRDRHR
jgi:fructose-1,6-bisphosphatase/sedoheptulose 1,7-bisphosphatase-like protein